MSVSLMSLLCSASISCMVAGRQLALGITTQHMCQSPHGPAAFATMRQGMMGVAPAGTSTLTSTTRSMAGSGVSS